MTAPPAPPSSARTWLIAFGLCVVAVVISIRFVDHPVADFVQSHFHGTALSHQTNRVLEFMDVGAVPLLAAMLVVGVGALDGRAAPPWARPVMLAGWSVMWALALCVVLKHAFGRGNVEPIYVARHVDEFHWLRGNGDYLGFPSGTMSVVGALAGVLWTLYPRLRWFAVFATALIFLALIVVNGHWVADLIGGTFLGFVVSAMTVRLLDRHA